MINETVMMLSTWVKIERLQRCYAPGADNFSGMGGQIGRNMHLKKHFTNIGFVNTSVYRNL